MSRTHSYQPFAVLRRAASVLPLRYRCVALLVATLMFFPLVLLGLGVSALLQGMPRAAGATRWVAGSGAGTARLTHLKNGAKLAGLPVPSADGNAGASATATAATVAAVTVPTLQA